MIAPVGEAAVVPSTSAEVDRQHHALDVEISELRGVIASCAAPRRSGSYHRLLAVLVNRLGDRLEAHFTGEAEGLYIEAVAARPALRLEIARFHRAHAGLLAAGRELADALRAPQAPPDGVARTLHWLDELASHESEERSLLL